MSPLTPEERAVPEGWRLSDERLAEIDAALDEDDLNVPLDPSGVLSDTAVLLGFCSELRAEVRRLRGTGAAQPALTPEERYQLETIRLRHAADEDHMESGNSDGREWTFTAIGIHGQRGDLLHIIDRLNAAATCPASGALMAEADHFPDVKEMVPHPAAVGLLRTMWLHDNHRLSYRCNWAACLDAIEALEPELGKRARSGEELESILRSVGAIDP